MLDALKFAFEIMVVGALSLPWIALLRRIFDPDSKSILSPDLSFFPSSAQSAVTVAVVIAFGYVAGSVISRASRNMFDDDHLLFPTESGIRDTVYQDEYCSQGLIYLDENLPFFERLRSVDENLPSAWHPPMVDKRFSNGQNASVHREYRRVFCPSEEAGPSRLRIQTKLHSRIQEMFNIQEGELLLLGQDKVDRLKQYYDQITILRGAAFNGFILSVLCLFACCGTKARDSQRTAFKLLAFVPLLILTVLSCWSLQQHVVELRRSVQTLRIRASYARDPSSFEQLVEKLSPSIQVSKNEDQESRLDSVLDGLDKDPHAADEAFGKPPLRLMWERGYGDPPFSEIVLILLSFAGFLVMLKLAIPKAGNPPPGGSEERPPEPASYGRTCAVALVVTLMCFGGWWWTEVMYDLQVAHSQVELHPNSLVAGGDLRSNGPEERNK